MASEVKSLALGLWGALVMGRINPKQDKTPQKEGRKPRDTANIPPQKNLLTERERLPQL